MELIRSFLLQNFEIIVDRKNIYYFLIGIIFWLHGAAIKEIVCRSVKTIFHSENQVNSEQLFIMWT